MATELRLRRGTTDEHGNFIGAEAEATVDTDKNTVVVHDGQTQGGFPLAKEDIATSYTDLRSKSVNKYEDGYIFYVGGRNNSGDGGEGHFRWDSSDLSSEVGNDEVTAQEGDGGVYVAPASDKTGKSGAWVRQNINAIDPLFYGGNETGVIQAIASANAGIGNGVVDCRGINSTLTFNSDAWNGAKDVTVLTGPNTWELDTESAFFEPYHGCIIEANGTLFRTSADGKGGNAGLGLGFFTTYQSEISGDLTSGSADLQVSDASDIRVGCPVAVRGFKGADDNQQATISEALDDVETEIDLNDASGFGTSGVVKIEDEYIEFDSISGDTLTNCTRGAFGTTAASHSSGANAKFVPAVLARVVSVSGTTVTLDSGAADTLTGVRVQVGAKDVKFRGTARFDGRQTTINPNYNLVGINAYITSGFYISNEYTFDNWDHGGIFLNTSFNYDVGGGFGHNGRRADGLGSDIWIFAGAVGGRIKSRYHLDSNISLAVDSRSSGTFDSLIARCKRFDADMGPMIDCEKGMVLEAASEFTARVPYIDAELTGIELNKSTQWTTGITPSNCFVQAGRVIGGNKALSLSSIDTNRDVTVFIADAFGTVDKRPGNYVWTGSQGVKYVEFDRYFSEQKTVDFPSISSNARNVQDVTIAGAQEGDEVNLTINKNAASFAGIQFSAWVNAPDTVRIEASNTTHSTSDPGSNTFTVTVRGGASQPSK